MDRKRAFVVGHQRTRNTVPGESADPLKTVLIEVGFEIVVFYDNRGSLERLLTRAAGCYCVILREPLFRESPHTLLDTVKALREMDGSQIILVTLFPTTQPLVERSLRAAGVNEIFVGLEEAEAVSLAAAERRRLMVPLTTALSAEKSSLPGGRGREIHLHRPGPTARGQGTSPKQGQPQSNELSAKRGRHNVGRNQLANSPAKRSARR